MPVHLKAMLVVLAISTICFAIIKTQVCSRQSGNDEFKLRRNLWVALTLCIFLAHNFWVYIIAAALLLNAAVKHEPNKLALYFFVLFAVPAIPQQITGLGLINHFFEIDYVRLLSLFVLLPAYLEVRRQPGVLPFGRIIPDKFIMGYLLLLFVLTLQVSNVPYALRQGFFYAVIDVVLPYYVASRYLGNLESYRDAMLSFAIAAMVLAPIAAFESAKSWLLYVNLSDAMGVERWGGRYLSRGDGGALRALGTVGHSIPLGYVMAVAIGFFLFFRRSLSGHNSWWFGMAFLSVGLVAPLSRGPWVGTAIILVVFLLTGPAPVKALAKIGMVSVGVAFLLLVSPIGEKVINHLPFVGTVDSDNIEYRERLIVNSIEVILKDPYFGSFDYMLSEEMQEMVQGQGIIDIVNTYIAVALGSGVVGLSLFCGFFLSAAVGVLRAMRGVPDTKSDAYLLGRVLIATLIGILVMIFTVSSVTIIPTIYWAMAGLCVGYVRLVVDDVQVQGTGSSVTALRTKPLAR